MIARNVVAASGAALLLAACGSSSGGAGSAGAPASAGASGASTAPAAGDAGSQDYGYGGGNAATAGGATGGATLKIASFAYDPTPLTVSPGQVVSVTNTDSAEHTATSDQAGLFVGDDITQGKTVTFKAPTTPGKYTFHCAYHASMHGTLIVK